MSTTMETTAKQEQAAANERLARTSRIQRFFNQATVRIAVLVIAFLWTLPTAGLFISSFRTEDAISSSGWWTVFATPFDFTQWTIENYVDVITTDGMGAAFINSLLVTIPATVIPITIAAFAAYAFAWMKFPGRDLLFAIVVGLLVVPLHMALIPMLRVFTALELNGTLLGIWLAHTGFGLPLAIYLLHGYIAALPSEMMESAAIDGASPMRTFIQLVLPLSVPAVASFAIFQFLWVWNDLLVALVFFVRDPSTQVVTSRLSEIVGSRGQDWEVLTAGAFVTIILPLVVFFALQRYFVRGLMAGSVKG
ncbi:MAG: carbohydrate ABC transporter permease [Chloroflexi bacterium]|nr:carbohydrate ABC transporter permease [Chloroflexota bacterium]